MTVLFLTTVGFAILRTKALPAWTGKAALAIAAINLVFVPSLFFGHDAAHFYSSNGWGSTALVASFRM